MITTRNNLYQVRFLRYFQLNKYTSFDQIWSFLSFHNLLQHFQTAGYFIIFKKTSDFAKVVS